MLVSTIAANRRHRSGAVTSQQRCSALKSKRSGKKIAAALAGLSILGVVLWMALPFDAPRPSGKASVAAVVASPEHPNQTDFAWEHSLDETAPAESLDGALVRPGPPKPSPAVELVRVLNQDIVERVATHLEEALAGNALLAGSLANDMEICANYFKRLDELSVEMRGAEFVSDQQALEGVEEKTLAYLNATSRLKACEGLSQEDLAKRHELLRIAATGGDVSAIGPFIDQGLSRESLVRYLSDPSARESFRREASQALEYGVRNCHGTSFGILGQLYGNGLLVPRDSIRSLGYQLSESWIAGATNASELPNFAHSLNPEQYQAALRFAHAVYRRYCLL